MNDINYLKKIVNKRICAILLPGNSINELDSRIEDFANTDFCWCSLGAFDIFEKYMLSRIHKQLDIVLDCASVPHARIEHYEKYARIPRLQPFLERTYENAWVTTHGTIRDSVTLFYPQFLTDFSDKIIQLDKIFPQDNIGKWMDVPNSITFLIAVLLASEASKIIIFGLDGYKGELSKGIDSYYHPEHVITERIAAHGSLEDYGINRDTNNFELRFPSILKEYRELFGNNAPIYNCSPKSIYTTPEKITYKDLEVI